MTKLSGWLRYTVYTESNTNGLWVSMGWLSKCYCYYKTIMTFLGSHINEHFNDEKI